MTTIAEAAADVKRYALILRGPDESPIVNGVVKPRIQSRPLYCALRALVEAGAEGVLGKTLVAAVGAGGRDRLMVLAKRSGWSEIIATPGAAAGFTGGSYQIIGTARIDEPRPLMPADVAQLDAADQRAALQIINHAYISFDHPRYAEGDRLLALADAVPERDVSGFTRWMVDRSQRPAPCPRIGERQHRDLILALQYCRHQVKGARDRIRGGEAPGELVAELLRWHRRAVVYRNRILGYFLFAAAKMVHERRLKRDRDELISAVVEKLIEMIEHHDPNSRFGVAASVGMTVVRAVFNHVRSQCCFERRHQAIDPDLVRCQTLSSASGIRRAEVRTGYLEELRRILHQNAAGLSDKEMAALKARLAGGGRQGLAPSQQVARQLSSSITWARRLFNTALSKIRAALERAMSRARVLELVAERQRARAAGCPA